MKRTRIFGILFLLVGAAFVAAQTNKIVLKVKVQRANIRSEMNMTAPVIKEVTQGTLLEATQKSGEWYEVTVTNDLGVSLTGYIHMNTVDEVGGQEPPPPVKVKPKPAPPTTPVSTETPIEDRGYAPMKSGFKVFAAYGLANYSYSSDANTAALDDYKKALGGIAAGFGFESGGQFGLEVDVLYLPKGVRYKGATDAFGAAGTFDFKITTAEISVPILIKLTVASRPGIYLLGGGEIAYVLSAKANYSYDVTGLGSDSGSEDFKENINQLDYGVVLGGGVSLPLGTSRLFAEARYHLGMANMQKNNAGYEELVSSGFSPKTNVLLILGGIRF